MDPITLGLILGLIERAIVLAPQVADLIQRASAGEKITPEEIERTVALVNSTVDRWKSAGDRPEEK